jgi:hypothetical protein
MPPDDRLTRWARDLLRAHHDWTTLTVGHGWDQSAGTSQAWLDITDRDGHHLATEPERFTAPTLPEDLVLHMVPIGSTVVYVPCEENP